MKPIIIATLVCITLTSFGADVPMRDSFYEIRSTLHRRLNGVKLVATASVAKDDADSIEIKWFLDYKGSRPPLVIVPPSLKLATNGCSEVVIYAQPKGGKAHEMRLASPTQLGKFWVPEEWFLIVERGKQATGVIQIRVSEIKEYFLKHWPETFQAGVLPELRIQLEHKPTMRGEEHHLDAWTGHLYSSVVLLELKEW